MSSPPRFAILGTAGHIDHGKTSLVRMLTGVDTDRLKEEQERGISIDLGFAHLSLPSGTSCGLVDVPGHERFVKNMLAGAGGVDAVLIAIAADEGVMPQTREHLNIVRLLGVKHGVVALTKIDMVEPDWLELVTESVQEYMESLDYGDFIIVPVSSKTNAGKEELLQAIDTVLSQVETKTEQGRVRLPVDRSFSVTGFGTVITGTLWQGTIKVGDKLMVEPGSYDVRVRNVQVHGQDADLAHAGQRVAVAVHGVDRQEIPRGSWLVAPDSFKIGSMLDVRIRVLEDTPRPIRRRQRIRFHIGASEVLARVVPLETEELLPGQEGLAQIRLEKPALVHRGDRFVIRSYSPSHTIAGGTVIVADAKKRRLHDKKSLEELKREETGSPRERIMAVLGDYPAGVALSDLAARSGIEESQVKSELESAGDVVFHDSDVIIQVGDWKALKEQALRISAAYQKKHVLRWGIPKGDLKSALPETVPPHLFQELIQELVDTGDLATRNDLFREGGEPHHLGEDVQKKLESLRQTLSQSEMTPPLVKELTRLLGTNPEPFLEYLVFEGDVVRISSEIYYNKEALHTIGGWLQKHFLESNTLSVSDLRDGLHISRKYSVPVLEYFDNLGWTRRTGDHRIVGRRLGEWI